MQYLLSRLLGLSILLLLGGCLVDGAVGDCGPVLSAAECQIARVQLGLLPPAPPPDLTSRVGQGGVPGGSDPLTQAEQTAYELGRSLFFDQCLSSNKAVACVTCHDPGAAFIDSRPRQVTVPVSVTMNGTTTTVRLAPIKDATSAHRPLSPELVTIPPPDVAPQLDYFGEPLALWNATTMEWEGITRRPQASTGSKDSIGSGFTGRNSPSMYNVAYGAVTPPTDGSRTAGVTWGPWDGRYDSMWSLVADVFEFGGTQRSNRAHVALRIYRNFRNQYEATFGGPMPDFDATDINGNRIYPTDASPLAVNPAWKACWNSTSGENQCPAGTLAPTPSIESDINQVFVNSGKALSAYLRRLRSGDSPYDKWLQNPADPNAMSAQAQQGLRLFMGKAECILCHNGPNFTDWRFHNLGVPQVDPEAHISGSAVAATPPGGGVAPLGCSYPGAAPAAGCPDEGRYAWQNRLSDRCESKANCQNSSITSCLASGGIYNDSNDPAQCLPPTLFDPCNIDTEAGCKDDPACTWAVDPTATTQTARCIPLATQSDLGTFKTPSLRNVARTWPYMHNGILSDFGPALAAGVDPSDPNADPTPHLTRVVEFYNQGGGVPVVGTLDPSIRPLNLSPSEVADLVEFLKSLTDESVAAGEAGMVPDLLPNPPNPMYPLVANQPIPSWYCP
jgi:cytochrome c peroxidase